MIRSFSFSKRFSEFRVRPVQNWLVLLLLLNNTALVFALYVTEPAAFGRLGSEYVFLAAPALLSAGYFFTSAYLLRWYRELTLVVVLGSLGWSLFRWGIIYLNWSESALFK